MTVDALSLQNIQKLILDPRSKTDWLRPEQSAREDLAEFKTIDHIGLVRLAGGKVIENGSIFGFVMFCKFNDLQGTSQTLKFLPYWLPQDCRQVAQQCYMHMNELQGRDHWADIRAVKMAHQDKVLPGRIQEPSEE